MKQNKDINIRTGGYSGTGMLPFYAGFCSAILLLAPVIGLGLSAALMYLCGIVTAAITRIYFSERVEFDEKAYRKAWSRYKTAVPSTIPDIDNYIIRKPSRFSLWRLNRQSAKTKRTEILKSNQLLPRHIS